MKAIEERNLPFPVLLENGGDYSDSHFNVDCKITITEDKKDVLIKFDLDLKCKVIENLIEMGKIMPVVNISQRTFRKTAPLLNDKEVKIPLNWLSPNHNIEIMPMLVAREDFCFSYHESMDVVFSYFDDDFTVKRYQIVGYGNFIQGELPTNSKVGSIFTISKLNDKNEIAKGNPYIMSFDQDVIDIKVLPDIHNSFFNSLTQNASFNKMLYSTVVYPAVQLALLTIFQDYQSFKNYKWCIAITNKIAKEKGINFETVNQNFSKDDISEYTNIVLGTLLQDAFKDIEYGGE